ncbi:MAG: hypothetical protein P8K78_08170, partial [Pirellulales bacterium]|nr:hypothetical protein [Pirellulales bacterium]
TQWWSENRERLESAGGSDGKIDDQNDSGALSSREYASGEGKNRSSNGPEKVLAQKIGRMRLSSGSGKGKNDYFVYYLAQVVPNQGVAEIQFKVIQGQEDLADILVRGNDGTNLQQQYTHWQILERHKTQAAADAALQRRRQAYDQFSQYRNRMRQTINVRNTRRC